MRRCVEADNIVEQGGGCLFPRQQLREIKLGDPAEDRVDPERPAVDRRQVQPAEITRLAIDARIAVELAATFGTARHKDRHVLVGKRVEDFAVGLDNALRHAQRDKIARRQAKQKPFRDGQLRVRQHGLQTTGDVIVGERRSHRRRTRRDGKVLA